MNARNPQYNAFGTIDLEIDHPQYGWIPFTASPDDPGGADIYAQAIAGEFGDVAEYVAPPPPPPPPPPSVVSMRQARLALLQANLLSRVQAAIESMPEPQRTAALIEWDYSSEVHRHRPFVQGLAGALNLSETDLDNLFTLAGSL
jgi:hypothetical protein